MVAYCGGSALKKRVFPCGFMRVIFLALAVLMFLVNSFHAEASTYYVTQNGGGTKNGTSWTNAYGEAQFITALQNAPSGSEFWVASGAYRPTEAVNRDISFVLKSGVALYGGFDGSETTRNARNWESNVTVLTGDLQKNDSTDTNGVTAIYTDIAGTNSRTVVTGSGTDSTAILDGFTVCGGAEGTLDNEMGGYYCGGGMYDKGGSPTVTNCTFAGNTAAYGGGVYNRGSNPGDASNPEIENCIFTGNAAVYDGGGIYNRNLASPTIASCTLRKNSARDGNGGGMYNFGSFCAPTVKGCTFTENAAFGNGGGLYNSNVNGFEIVNCTFAGNTASVNAGAAYNGDGGGLYNSNVNGFEIVNCTFTANAVSGDGSGAYSDGGSSLAATNCIFWDTLVDAQQEISGTATVAYSVVQNGYPGGTAIIDTDPGLVALADNGGPTQTCAIDTTSSAYNAGTSAGAPEKDQRGLPRDVGNPDVGAYEYQPNRKVLTVITEGNGSVSRSPQGTALANAEGGSWYYPAGTAVTLTANSVSPWVLTGWSGTPSNTATISTASTAANFSIVMNTDFSATATFTRRGYAIAVSAEIGGSIRPSGNVMVNPGSSQTFTITPWTGFRVNSVLVDGLPVGAVTTYTLSDVHSDHTISAFFSLNLSPDPTSTPVPTATATPVPTATSTPAPTAVPTPIPTIDPAVFAAIMQSLNFFCSQPSAHCWMCIATREPSCGSLYPGDVALSEDEDVILNCPALREAMLEDNPQSVAAGAFVSKVDHFSMEVTFAPEAEEVSVVLDASYGPLPKGYSPFFYFLARTYDEEGNPLDYVLLEETGENGAILRISDTSVSWTLEITDGSEVDSNPEAGVVDMEIAVVVIVPQPVAVAPSGGGGGCVTLATSFSALFLLVLPLLLFKR